ncbi:MAG: cytochrome P450, partial [Gaiellaceae bacterium]
MAETSDLVPQLELAEAEEAERQERFPAGAAIAFPDLEEHGRAGALDRLRETEPVSWVPALGGWLVTSYPLARNVLARTGDFTVWAEPNLVRASLGVMMLTSDPPDHERQRLPFDEPFRMRAVRERFEERVSARVEQLLDELAPRGSCELAVEFAAPFAIGVAGDILGLSLDDVPKIQGFYEAFAHAMVYDGDPEPQRRADAAREALNEILGGELARVRAQPDGSITSAVVNDPATELTDDAIVAQLRVILFGAIETAESMVVNAVLLLLEHPDQLDAVQAGPSLVSNAVEEAMR